MFTVNDVLFPQGEPPAAVAEALDQTSRRRSIGTLYAPAVSAVASLIASLADVPVVNLLSEGWRRHRVVAQTLEQSRAAPRDVYAVVLDGHVVSTSRTSAIVGEVNGVELTIAEVAVSTELRIEALTLRVQAGAVVESSPLRATVAADLALTGGRWWSPVTLVRRTSPPLELRPVWVSRDRG